MDFTKLDGLVPAVVQDFKNNDVLMVGFMNQEAWDITKRTGETSGNKMAVRDILIDCDDDTVLVKAELLGDGVACHTGARTCFNTRAEGITIP
jgi:phosphoribosyl-AMP cyclohydrolase